MLGLLLSGSRAAGVADERSDYDVVWVVRDEAFAGRGLTPGNRTRRRAEGQPPVEVEYSCPRELARLIEEPSWRTPDYATAVVLFDRDGRLGRALEAMRRMPPELADAEARRWLDAYLNGFFRSIKAWRRGDELGARLHATASVGYLVRTLFALERLWPQHFDRLHRRLPALDVQGWAPGSLADTFLRLCRTGDPRLQQGLSARVELLARERGLGQVIDAWDDDLARARAHRFDQSG